MLRIRLCSISKEQFVGTNRSQGLMIAGNGEIYNLVAELAIVYINWCVVSPILATHNQNKTCPYFFQIPFYFQYLSVTIELLQWTKNAKLA